MKLTKLTKLTEGKLDIDLDKWMDQNRAHSFEGSKGIKNLSNLVRTLDPDYRSIEEFLSDNSGAIEALLKWISNANVPEWAQNIKDATSED